MSSPAVIGTAKIDYDDIAESYDGRYTQGPYDRVLEALRAVVTSKKAERVLEAGCGTGYWLQALSNAASRIYGLDYSFEMLRKSRERDSTNGVVRATAEVLPFLDATLDLIFCINAIHHFGRYQQFISEARRVLRAGGTLGVIGMDPRQGRDYWCVYDYLPETKPTDLARYPSSGQIIDAMIRAGFDRMECGIACRFGQTRVGDAVFDDPELRRNGCSQMALLTDDQYAAGIERIRCAIRHSKPAKPAVFKVDIAMMMQCGYVR